MGAMTPLGGEKVLDIARREVFCVKPFICVQEAAAGTLIKTLLKNGSRMIGLIISDNLVFASNLSPKNLLRPNEILSALLRAPIVT